MDTKEVGTVEEAPATAAVTAANRATAASRATVARPAAVTGVKAAVRDKDTVLPKV